MQPTPIAPPFSPSLKSSRRHLLPLIVAFVVTGLALLPIFRLSIPRPSSAPAAQRAMQTITTLSVGPRYGGSASHLAAREFLQSELRALGLEVQAQEFTAPDQPASLVNIVGRRAGRNPGSAVLLMAHYDSKESSPGASDNGSGTAVVLELARKLAQAPQPANDLIILFTDGEDQGVLGSPVFLEQHPWAKSVRVALNFDGLSLGPVFLWQSSAENGWLIEHYADTPRPWGMSWADSIARVMPLDTDFRPFKDAGITGASLTTPYLPVAYHTPNDKVSLVNPATLEHAIVQGQVLASRLLESDLARTVDSDRAYFNLWGNVFIQYDGAAAAFLGILISSFMLTVLIDFLIDTTYKDREKLRAAGSRMQTIILQNLGAGLLAIGSGALFTLANLLGAALLQLAIELLVFMYAPFLSPWVRILASVALLTLVFGWAWRWMQKRLSTGALMVGAQALMIAPVFWTGLTNPLLSPPLTFILLASMLSMLPYAQVRLRLKSTVVRALQVTSLALILFLGAPLVYLLYLISGIIFIPALIAAMAWVLILALVQPLWASAAAD